MLIKRLQQSTFRRYAAIVLSPFFYFCCFRCVIMPLWCDKLRFLHLFKIMGTQHIGVTTLIFLGHVKPSCECVSYWNRVSIFNRFRDIYIQIYLVHDLGRSVI